MEQTQEPQENERRIDNSGEALGWREFAMVGAVGPYGEHADAHSGNDGCARGECSDGDEIESSRDESQERDLATIWEEMARQERRRQEISVDLAVGSERRDQKPASAQRRH